MKEEGDESPDRRGNCIYIQGEIYVGGCASGQVYMAGPCSRIPRQICGPQLGSCVRENRAQIIADFETKKH